MKRLVLLAFHDEVSINDHLSGLGTRRDEAAAYFESPRDALSASASVDETGQVKMAMSGRAPQGEQDTVLVCRLLIDKLNAAGANWGALHVGTQDVDCWAEDGSGRRLQIQVVRAVVDGAIWRSLSTAQRADIQAPASGVVDHLRQAIEKKANQLTEEQRRQLVLALDANRMPGFGFPVVAKEFMAAHGTWAKQLDFAAIWIVGPEPRLVVRVDG